MAAAKPGTVPEFVLWTRRLLSASNSNPDPGPVRHLLHAICAFRLQFQPYRYGINCDWCFLDVPEIMFIRAVLIPPIISIVERRLSSGAPNSFEFRQVRYEILGGFAGACILV